MQYSDDFNILESLRQFYLYLRLFTFLLKCSIMVHKKGEKRTENTMWIAENWKDYEVLDTRCGEKLERWGKYLLIRPDPQVIWQTEEAHEGWRHPNGHYHRSSKGGAGYYYTWPQEAEPPRHRLNLFAFQADHCGRIFRSLRS